ncbi:Ig-like domain-containing protein [Weeksellaceae bacterium TAE3-ERU29]|nr:Ig-like domain-containing protein [Weeksellaceae bacterium TAE3-ERU29]
MNKVFIILIALTTLFSCARRGNPTGGPKDITPPKLLRATPDTLSTNVPVDLKEIRLTFDELVQLRDYTKNVLISPPVEPSPTFSPIGTPSREVKVKFNEHLKKNTTYTINFGKSIVDNNESNPFSYFTYVFSTGPRIDSLQLVGAVQDLTSKKPEQGLIAALYEIDSAYTDSLVFKEKPYYIAKLDSTQTYHFKYLKPGKFRLVAFNDKIPNSKIDLKQEKMAFADTIIDTRKISTAPMLYLFEPPQDFRYLDAKQNGYGRIDFYVTGKPKDLKVIPTDERFSETLTIHKPYSDTLQFYFNPKKVELERRTRLRFLLAHDGVSDSIPTILYDNSAKAGLKITERKLNYVPGKNYILDADYPIDTINKDSISVKIDTMKLAFDVERVNEKRFKLKFPIKFEKNYKIELLPGAFTDWTGNKNDSTSFSFSTQKERDYGNLKLTIQNKPTHKFWLKLYDANDKEIESIYSDNSVFEFKYLLPQKYYFKLMVDENENRRYDSGNIFLLRQPEKVYVYSQEIDVKPFWDINETWVLP